MTHNPSPPALEAAELEFAHSGGRHRLAGIGLRIERSEVACLLGPNGAGKTTLLRCLLGLLTPSRGTVRLAGEDLAALPARQRARHVAYVPQSTATTFPFTALDIAVMGRTPHLPAGRTPTPADRATALGVLQDLGVGHLADRSIAQLSGGERSLVLIARALVQQAHVLVLDEPTAALDLGNARRVLDAVARLARSGHTVVMTTHQPDHALHYADRAILLSDGRLVADGAPDVVLTSERLTQVYATPVHVGTVALPGQPVPTPVCVPVLSDPAVTPETSGSVS
ncbi:ABC transporter ATP-binding protein [Pseudonocardia asaccharolytica]|uniref:ABC transporter ATP-binding protein n=1 Tax=Pseudonocardia asaccharolytica TaxID=54010 RepID=UPI0004105435|nr:ABC transporter ATP-binding protein [Pseudonocardia asaccharolytica]